ncbi:hypothetical protein ACFRFS_18585, partial [Streptomyces sp. NPDC056730]
DVRAVVLGCTHYELVAERIRTALRLRGLPAVVLHGSAGAVAAQALRRIDARSAPAGVEDGGEGLVPASAGQGATGVNVPLNGQVTGVPVTGVPVTGVPVTGVPVTGRLTVLLGGRESALPGPALAYAEGRLLVAVSQVH